MAPQPIFEHEIDFDPTHAAEALRAIPAASGIVALFGRNSTDKPYIVRAANLRRRLQRLLEPAEGQTKRLNLRDRIARIAWREAGSDFEALLILHRAMSLAFGVDEARKRMRLTAPYTVRFAAENRFPRIYVTNHLRRRSLQTTFGPFASRFAAERYCEAIEDLFLIRRCYLELHPSPDDPGCIYGEMHKCLAPCQARVTDKQYNDECAQVLAFLNTQGASRITALEAERDEASANMLFEEAAATHTRIAKVKAAAALADELIQPLTDIRAILLMPIAASASRAEPQIAIYGFSDGCFSGPQHVSLLGVRLAKEQAEVGSSLFAQPLMLSALPLAPVPLAYPSPKQVQNFVTQPQHSPDSSLQLEPLSDSSFRPERSGVEQPAVLSQPLQDRVSHLREAKVGIEAAHTTSTPPNAIVDLSFRPDPELVEEGVENPAALPSQQHNASPEERLLAAVAGLENTTTARDTTELGDHLALLKRWYYRPEKQRTGAIFFRERDAWPVRRMLRTAARIATAAAAHPTPSTQQATPGEGQTRPDAAQPTPHASQPPEATEPTP